MKKNYNFELTAFASVVVKDVESEDEAIDLIRCDFSSGDLDIEEWTAKEIKTDVEMEAFTRHANDVI